ncbi:WG repeat-containing protein [Mycoplasmatota bacterium zrk1]
MKKTRSIASIFILVLIFLVGCNSNNNDISENAHAIIYTYPNQFALIDVDGTVVTDYVSYIEDIYQVAAEFNEGLSPNLINGESYNYGYINTEFEIVVPHQYYYAGPFSEGLAVVEDSELGILYINDKEEVEIDVDFYMAKEFHEGLAAVNDGSGKWGYINRKGDLLIDIQFDEAYDFSSSLVPLD